MMTEIVKFDPLRAEVAKYKKINENLVFDYESPEGNKKARSHIFKLRKVKTQITEVHREVKAEALAACQAIDAEKRLLTKGVDSMIDVHAEPLRIIKQREEEKTLAVFRAQEEARLADEARAQRELEEREAAVARKEAEIKAKEDAIRAKQERVRLEAERVERDKRIAAEAAETARQEMVAETLAVDNVRIAREADDKRYAEARAAAEKKAIEDAAAKEIADAKAEALAKENARLAKEAAEKAEKERLEAIENRRKANEEHRAKVKAIAIKALEKGLGEMLTPQNVVAMIDEGHVPNVTINY